MGEKIESKLKRGSGPATDDPERIYRMYNVLSYFIVLVVIGLPIWWFTTRVYRASLPIDEINDITLPNRSNKPFGIPLSLEYDVLITIVNPDPARLELALEGERIDAALQPFLSQLAPIADFVVKSQWLYLVELGAVPRKIVDHYALFAEQLPHVITPLEKKLWSHMSPRPCLNLVLYVSHCGVPLYIYRSEGERSGTNAFLSARWGGITIVNADAEACARGRYAPDLREVASIFVAQLEKLLGLANGDLAGLKEQKARDMVYSTRRTLQSLAQLLSEINSIVISDGVAEKIHFAVKNADLAEEKLNGGDIEEGLKFAKEAFKNSEAAFSDPSLLALLYFPDDQKYAVYIPLFLPVMIPVLMSLITLRSYYKKTKLD